MFASSLPLLPPPPTSLLPSLHDRPVPDASSITASQNSLQAQQQQQQQQQRRTRGHPHSMYPRSDIAILASDERAITQRKLAIAMYGYSWLKPAGCIKTMLGRREEEIEREEVERQLREVELQEQNAAEAEDAERESHLNQQRAREAQGEDVGAEGEHDLDEDVPDMDEEDADDFEDDGDSDEDDEEGEENLDHSMPEGDSAWRYDTTRDLDSESEDETRPRLRLQPRQSQSQVPALNTQNRAMVSTHGSPANSTLYEDDLGEYDQDHDLDDGIPDEDRNQNLDDDIPDAESEDGEWEHTDTELEESEMDISIMPPGVTAHHNQISSHPANTRDLYERGIHYTAASQQSEAGSGIRRISGNVPSSLPTSNPPINPPTGARGLMRSQHQRLNFTPDQVGSDFSASALISTGHTEASSAIQQQQPGNSFSDTAGPRRNLFGASRIAAPRNNGISRDVPGGQTFATAVESSFEATQNVTASFQSTASRQVSSGGLFTPSPQQQNAQRVGQNTDSADVPSRITRSGRVISRIDRMRAARRPGAA